MSDKSKLQETLKALREEYAQSLPKELEAIDNLWDSLQQTWDSTVLEIFQRSVHKLTGNAGAFGFSALSEAARPLDSLLLELRNDKQEVVPNSKAEEIAKYLSKVHEAAQQPDAPQESPKPEQEPSADVKSTPLDKTSTNRNKLVYLVEDDEYFAKLLSVELESRGYTVKIFNKVKGLPQAIKYTPPAAVIMDVMLNEGQLAGPKVMFQLQKSRATPLPSIFISARNDMEARLAAVRANGDAYFTKPFDFKLLAEKLDALTHNDSISGHRVLIVDDSGRYGDKYVKILRQSGMEAKILSQPVRCLDALEKFPVDLVMINTQLSGVSGMELAMVVRQQEKHSALPLVFFAQQFDRTVSSASMIGIADDYLSENISAAELVSNIANRIKQSKQKREQWEELRNRDSLTNLYNRSYFVTELNRLGEQAHPGKPLTVLYINLDNCRGIEKIQGLHLSDALVSNVAKFLQTCVRPDEILARLGEGIFGFLSIGRNLNEIRELAEHIRATVEQHITEADEQRVMSTCSIGIGVHQGIAKEGIQQLLKDATTACETAQKAGGNRIHLHETALAMTADRNHFENIRRAIEMDSFVLAFQPITPLHGTPGAYYDVFLRLLLEDQERVSPAEFLRIAEECELTPQMDRWVVVQSVKRLEERLEERQKYPFNFFVRISKATLEGPDFLLWLAKLLKNYDFPRASLIFDVPLNLVKSDLKTMERFGEYARGGLGCRLCLRNFDASPASLQLLNMLEIHVIKVHQDVMAGINNDEEQAEQLTRIVAAAHAQGVAVVAPFVEDVTTLSLLWQYEVDYITGYFIQPPGDSLDYDFDQE